MALRVQASFAAGELDPALQERTTLDKYASGLAAARNIIVAKTGRLITRSSRQFFATTKNTNEKSIIYSPPYSGIFVEWGNLYARVYSLPGVSNIYGVPEGILIDEYVHTWTEDDLPNVNFESSQAYIYAFCAGKTPLKLFPGPGGGFVSNIFNITATPTAATVSVGGTGYNVDYQITCVRGGQESLPFTIASGKMPINTGESNSIDATLGATAGSTITEMRLYRRPRSAGAFGYVGSTSFFHTSGSNTLGTFSDIGGDADYTHSPPTIISSLIARGVTGPSAFGSSTGIIYQQRLLLTDQNNEEAIEGSRTGFQNNFYQDYPIGSDSAISFKSGSSGIAKVLRMIESDGLVVFTSVGVFVHVGALDPTNLTLDKRGNWVIDASIPPLAIPGGILFLDSLTNTVRVLAYSTEQAGYTGAELSIFSDHLFLGRKIVSWAFQDGETPLLWAIFNDGKFASFTYEPTQQMRAWTRHDSVYNLEYVAGTGVSGISIFLSENNGTRIIETTNSRYVSIAKILDDPEADKSASTAFMDAIYSWSLLIQDSLFDEFDDPVVYTGTLTVAPVVDGIWDGQLTITSSGSAQALFPVGTYGAPGSILRYFDPSDETSIDLVVVTHNSDLQIVVQPASTYPFENNVNPRLYTTKNVFTGLDYLEGQDVSIMVDGYVVCSPNNDVENFPSVQVTGGSVTLPSEIYGAIVHIGLPVTADIETLDIDTVEQRPVFIESKILNKLYVKIHRTRGLFCASSFPDDDKVFGMEELDSMDVNYSNDSDGLVLGNKFTAPQTKRLEVTLPGDWESQGKVCLRQVDPLHFEILSIIPDLEDERR